MNEPKGIKAEFEFDKFAKELGLLPVKSSRHEDMFHHIDYWITIGEARFSVDVKAFKRSTQNGKILIELLNVRGEYGWLYGKSDFIAFQTEDDWLMVERKKLETMVNDKMGISKPSELKHSNKSSFKDCMSPLWYRRYQRLDAITNINIKDVLSIE